jgi:hypothetical protein
MAALRNVLFWYNSCCNVLSSNKRTEYKRVAGLSLIAMRSSSRSLSNHLPPDPKLKAEWANGTCDVRPVLSALQTTMPHSDVSAGGAHILMYNRAGTVSPFNALVLALQFLLLFPISRVRSGCYTLKRLLLLGLFQPVKIPLSSLALVYSAVPACAENQTKDFWFLGILQLSSHSANFTVLSRCPCSRWPANYASGARQPYSHPNTSPLLPSISWHIS